MLVPLWGWSTVQSYNAWRKDDTTHPLATPTNSPWCTFLPTYLTTSTPALVHWNCATPTSWRWLLLCVRLKPFFSLTPPHDIHIQVCVGIVLDKTLIDHADVRPHYVFNPVTRYNEKGERLLRDLQDGDWWHDSQGEYPAGISAKNVKYYYRDYCLSTSHCFTSYEGLHLRSYDLHGWDIPQWLWKPNCQAHVLFLYNSEHTRSAAWARMATGGAAATA